MSTEKEKLGFIGIGLMGLPMATRLLEAGYKVTVWNRSKDKLKPLLKMGAIQAQSPKEVANNSDIIMLSLADTSVVEAIVFDDDGISFANTDNTDCSNNNKQKIVVDTSSVEPEATRNFAQRLKQKSIISWVDAPVSGGVVGAEQGTLAIMAGGSIDDFEILKPIMRCLSQRFTHMGEVGTGQLTKVCNQMIVSCNALVIAEVIALAKKSGVDAEKISEALLGGFADSKPLQILGPQMATESFEPVKWHVRTLLKDLDTAVKVAESEGNSIPMSKLGSELMRQHAENGYMEKDPTTLIKLY